ncbi:MAG: YdcF family protein [Gemmatimonadales bacterium]
MPLIKTRLRWAVGLLVLTAAAYCAALAMVIAASRDDQRRPVDAIVVLGAAQYNGRPSPVLRARLDHALILYRAGLAPIVVVTGGVAEGDRTSEAEVGGRYLQSNGVPDSAVAVVPEGRSTEASIVSVATWLRARQLMTVLLVSDPFHMLRLRLEARRLRLKAYTSPTTTSPISRSVRRELLYFGAEAFKVPVAWMRGWGREETDDAPLP